MRGDRAVSKACTPFATLLLDKQPCVITPKTSLHVTTDADLIVYYLLPFCRQYIRDV